MPNSDNEISNNLDNQAPNISVDNNIKNKDSTLSPDSADSSTASGLRTLIEKNNTSQTRLPMLEIIFNRLVVLLSSSYRAFTSFTVDVEIGDNTYMKFGEYVEKLPTPSMIGVVRAIEWENLMLLNIDSSLTYSLIEILFGGRKVASSIKVEGRPYTSIEQNIILSIVEIFLNELSIAFEPITPITFQLDRIESNPKFATITRSEDVVAVLKLQIRMEARIGFIELVIPYSTLEPVKKILQKSFLGERGSKDINWSKHIENELSNTNVSINVQFNGIASTIKNLASLKVGNTIMLDKEADDDICVAIDKIVISKGKIGKVDGNVAIRLSEPIDLTKYKG